MAVDYVYTTVKCYNEAIQSYLNNTYTVDKIQNWKKELATVFNRGFWDGYYLGKKMGEWSNENGSKSTKRKEYIAKGLKYFEQAKVGEFLCEAHNLAINDEVIITGPTTGYTHETIVELRIDGKPVNKVNRGDVFTFAINEKIRPSDKLYKLIPDNNYTND